MSPLIWNLVMDSLLRKFETGPCKAYGFADDVCLLIKGPDENTLPALMQEELRKVTDWCEQKGLSLNAAKTIPIMFTRKKK